MQERNSMGVQIIQNANIRVSDTKGGRFLCVDKNLNIYLKITACRDVPTCIFKNVECLLFCCVKSLTNYKKEVYLNIILFKSFWRVCYA